MLQINGKAFLKLPYQAEIAPKGPYNIPKGIIILLKGVQVNVGFTQYRRDHTIDDWVETHEL